MKKKILVLLVMVLACSALFAQITREEAESIAIRDSGVNSENILSMRSRLDWEDGERIYDIEFYADGVEYDYEIALSDGTVLSFDSEAERLRGSEGLSGISRDEAVQIALENAGFSSSEVSNLRRESDRDDGIIVYEINFRNGDFNYEYEISDSGEILSYSMEKRGRNRVSRDAAVIERSEAEGIISSYLPEGVSFSRLERDYDDGRYSYEASAYSDGIEYEVEIDAVTGELTSYQEEVERWR